MSVADDIIAINRQRRLRKELWQRNVGLPMLERMEISRIFATKTVATEVGCDLVERGDLRAWRDITHLGYLEQTAGPHEGQAGQATQTPPQ